MDPVRWKANIKEATYHIASKSYQEKYWFGFDERIVASPEEAYGLLFDYAFDEFLSPDDNTAISEEQREKGEKLRQALNRYLPEDGALPNEEYMINDPEWDKVRKVAQEFYDVL